MTTQSISRKHKIFILVLVCAILGTMFFGQRASAATVSGFNIGGLTATCDNSGDGYTTVNTTGNNSITVTTIAKESGVGVTWTYAQKDSTLTIKNGSGKALKITYSLTQGSDGSSGSTAGTFTPSGVEFGANKQVSIPAGGTVSVYITSGSRSRPRKKISDKCATSYTITVTNVEVEAKEIDVTFAAVAPLGGALPGTYTVTTDGETKTVSDSAVSYTKDINTQYKLEAIANEGYSFEGWYVNNQLVSSENPYENASFVKDNNVVEARFYDPDPIMNAATLNDPDGAGGTKYDYVKINSAYSHKETGHSRRTETLDGGVKDSVKTVYFPDPAWTAAGASAAASTSGTATGDGWTAVGEQSIAYAYIYTDVVCVQALRDSSISFKNDISVSGESSLLQPGETSSNFYYYVASSALNTATNVTGTVQKNGVIKNAGDSVQVSLKKGQYLYIFSYGTIKRTCYTTEASTKYSFTSTISNFTVTPNNTRFTLNVSFQDNIGTILGSGTVKIGDTAYTITSSGSPSSVYETISGSEVTLAVTKVPTGYVHIGWQDVTANKYEYTAAYRMILNESHEVKALFVPVMTITMGSNGYSNATYQYKSLTGNTVMANGQYVARNGDSTRFYTTLQAAFDDSTADSIVLLAGDTFNGDFTIPSGKTLVVPYGMDDRASTTPVEITTSSNLSSYYSTVTMNGKVSVDGGLMVSAKQAGKNGGYPGGYIGRLTLGSSATLTVNGKLYAFGYVSGGSIQVASSGAVYELVDIKDMRNAGAVYELYSDEKVFPFNNFYIKNIETAVTYQAGASLYGCIGVEVGGTNEVTTTTIYIIGNSGSAMFNLTSGTLTKTYDRANDMILFVVDEGSAASTGQCSFSMVYNAPIFGEQNIKLETKNYEVPLCAGYGIQVNGNFTFNDKFKLLPGTSLTVSKTGNLTIASGATLVVYRMNDYDARSSGKVANGEGYQGYTENGYPKYSLRFPSITGYPTARKAETTKSVQVHVDGTVNILGNWYVSNDQIKSGSYSQEFVNGYNNLTGTGTIIVGSSQNSSSSINEAKQKSDTNKPEYYAVNLSAIKGLQYTATEDAEKGYVAFQKNNTYYGYINPVGLSTWSTQKPVTLTYDANTEGSTDVTGSMDTVSAYPGASVTVAKNGFKWRNYNFLGWNTAADGTGTTYIPNDDGRKMITLTADTTLYAMWSKKFTVKWEADYTDPATTLKEPEEVEEGTIPTPPTPPAKVETEDYIYTFVEWQPAISEVHDNTTFTAHYDGVQKNVKLIHADATVDYYETVFTAVNASRAGETVMLLKDCTEPMIRIAQDKDLILDLNGKKITSESGSAIENNGTISITGSGTVSAASSGSAILNNGTIRSISGGTFIGAKVAGSGLLIAQGSKVGTISGGTFQGQYGINVAGTLDTINNATLTDTSTGLYVNGGTVNTISGDTFTGGSNGIYVINGGTVNTISGGTFTGGSIGLSVSNTGTVKTISGGTFVSTGAGGFAVKSSSGTAIEFVASGSPDSGNYNGPLFKSTAGTRAGTVDSPDSAKFTYPTGMTVSGKANTNGYFYIGANVFTIKFAPNDTTDEKVDDSTVVPDWTVDLSATEDINVPTAKFTRKGYIFQGWGVKNADGTEKIIIDEKATTVPLATLKGAWDPTPAAGDEVTLYAIWQPDKVYSVTVSWSKGLEYTYIPNEYTWNATEMRYEHTRKAGWIGANDSRNPTVTISNGGDKTDVTYGHINAGIQYTPNDAVYNGFTMDFLVDNMSMGKGSATLATKLAPKNSVTTTMKLEGTPFIGMDTGKPITIGTVALTLTTAD